MKTDYKKEIITELKRLSGRKSLAKIYSDWLHIMAYTLSNSADKRKYQKREEAYLEIVKQYNREELERFANCFETLIFALEYKMNDWLGEIYMELGINNKTMDQFFTPYHISKLMAEMTFVSNEEQLNEKKWIGYYEPCCGAGGLTIAFAEAMQRKNTIFKRSSLSGARI